MGQSADPTTDERRSVDILFQKDLRHTQVMLAEPLAPINSL